MLMGYGADPFIAAGNGSTPMELAIEANQQSLVQLMTGKSSGRLRASVLG